MRVNRLFSALMVATTIGATAVVTVPTQAQAKSTSSLKTFPKAMRGTWYHYEENNGYYYKSMKISSKKMTVKNFLNPFYQKQAKWTGTIHPIKNQRTFTEGESSKKLHWTSARSVKGGYTTVLPYGIGATNGGGTYKVIHKTYKGKSVKVLYSKQFTTIQGTKQVTDHFYKTKAQAKYFNPVGALHK